MVNSELSVTSSKPVGYIVEFLVRELTSKMEQPRGNQAHSWNWISLISPSLNAIEIQGWSLSNVCISDIQTALFHSKDPTGKVWILWGVIFNEQSFPFASKTSRNNFPTSVSQYCVSTQALIPIISSKSRDSPTHVQLVTHPLHLLVTVLYLHQVLITISLIQQLPAHPLCLLNH